MDKIEEIPEEHKQHCGVCDRDYDARDLGQVLYHMTEVCVTDEKPKDLKYSSRKIGEPVQYTKDKKPINLN